MMWWTRGALLLAWDWLRAPIFELTSQRPPDWAHIWTVLAPFFGLAALLASWLLYWSRRRRRILLQRVTDAEPMALEPATQAARYGVRLSDLEALRAHSIAVVHFERDGSIASLEAS